MLRQRTPWTIGAASALVPLLLAGCAEHAEYVVEPATPVAVVGEAPPLAGEPVPATVVAPVPAPVMAPVAWAVAPELVAAADAHAHAGMPNGARLGPAYTGVAYARKDFTDWMFPLEAGHCYAFGFAADGSVRKVQLSLWNPEHRRLDHERGLPPQGTLKHCAGQNGMYRLEARASGPGNFVVVAYGDPPPGVAVTPAPVAAAPLPAPLPATYVSGAPGPVVVSQAGSTVNVYTR